MQLASKIPPEPSNKLIRIEQKDAKETNETPSSESKSSTDFFSRLESNIFMDVLLLLGASAAIPMAKVNRLFRSTIRSLITKTNFKKNFIYSEIQPFKPYTITPELLLQKYIVLMRDLANGMQAFPYGSIRIWRYSSSQTTREGTKEFKFEVPRDFLDRIIFFVELGAINACKTFFKKFPSLFVRGAVYSVDYEQNTILPLLNHLIYSSIQSGYKHLIPLFGNTILDYHRPGYSYLMEAVQLGREEIVELLLANQRANTLVKTSSGTCKFIDEADERGYTALHFAALKGFLSIVKLLKRFGANTALCTEDGDTALHLCLYNRDIPLQNKIELLKLLATDLRMVDQRGTRLLYYLIMAGFPLDSIQHCYRANKELNPETPLGSTMSLAAMASYESTDEHLQVLNFLYEKMSFPCFDTAESKEQDDPFNHAILANTKPRVIQFFLDKHLAQAFAQENVPPKLLKGLQWLTSERDIKPFQDIFNYLKAKPQLLDQIIHKIALHAVQSGNLELVTLLLDRKWRFWESVNTSLNGSALHGVVAKGHVDVLRLFITRNCLEHKDDHQRRWVDWAPPGGKPVIFLAANLGCADAVDMLIGAGKAAIDHIGENGLTVLHETISKTRFLHPSKILGPSVSSEVQIRIFNTLYPLIPSQLRSRIIEKPDGHGFTFPLYAAKNNAPLPIFKKLAEDKCEFSQTLTSTPFPQLNGSNCLHLLALRDTVSLEVLTFFADEIRLPTDAPNASGHTPLYYAIACLNPTAVRFFLARNANALIPITNEIVLGWNNVAGQVQLQTGLIRGNALEIALSWNFFSEGRFNYFDKEGLKKEHLAIIHLLISHLQNMAKDALHPQQSAAKKALLDTALLIIEVEDLSIIERLSIFETLLETIEKESIPAIADAFLKFEEFYEDSQYFVILLKRFQHSALSELTEVFYRFCKELDDSGIDTDVIVEHAPEINIFLKRFINAGIDIASKNLLAIILGFESYHVTQPFKESIQLTITKLSVLPDKTQVKEILQKAAFTIIENIHPAEYLKMILDTGITISIVQSVENSPPKTLLSCVNDLIDVNLILAISYLELIVDKFVAEINLKELFDVISIALITTKKRASTYDEVDLAFFNKTINQLIKKLFSLLTEKSVALQTESPSSQSFSAISQALGTIRPDATMSSGEESKQEIHPPPVNLNFQGLGQNPGTSTPASPPPSSGPEMTLSMQLG